MTLFTSILVLITLSFFNVYVEILFLEARKKKVESEIEETDIDAEGPCDPPQVNAPQRSGVTDLDSVQSKVCCLLLYKYMNFLKIATLI